MSVNRRQFLQTLTALLGLPAISAVAAPDKELTDWVAKEQATDQTFLARSSDCLNIFLYARLFEQTFILNGDLELVTEPYTRMHPLTGWLEVLPIHRTLSISSSDRNFHKTVEKLFDHDWNYVEIGFITPEGSPKKLMDLHGVQLIGVSTTLGTDLPNAGALGLGMTYASMRYKLAEVDATKFGELEAL